MAYLLETADVPGTVRVERDGQVFHVPTARFDNRHDLTTFLRQDPADWSEEDVHALHAGIKRACDDLWQSYRAR
jgi:hypothetical protein